MDISLLREMLAAKTAINVTRGMNYQQALRSAQAEILGKAGRSFSRLDLFCFRARLTGAARSLAASRLK